MACLPVNLREGGPQNGISGVRHRSGLNNARKGDRSMGGTSKLGDFNADEFCFLVPLKGLILAV